MYVTDPATLAILAWLRSKRTWPPAFPRRDSLLTNYGDSHLPREQWGVDEWRAYAMFLEESGKGMVRDLIRIEQEAMDARQKLSRGKPQARLPTSMLTSGVVGAPKGRPGRKPSDAREKSAEEALAIKVELEAASGKRVSDMAALEEWFARKGMRRSRARENRNLVNAMVQHRKKHNISRR